VSTNLAAVPSPEVPASVEDKALRFVDFDQYLLNTARTIESINADADLDRLRLIVKMRKFYSGHQVGYVSKVDNRWVDKKKRGDALYVDPVLASFIDINVAQIVKSRPTIKVMPRAADRVDKEQSALYAQELLKDAQQQLFTANFLQREAKIGLQLSGEAYRITSFDKNVKGTEVRVPITEQKTVEPKVHTWNCPACEQSGEIDEVVKGQFAAGTFTCPHCGYWKVDQIAAEAFEAPVITGYQDVPAGDVRCESPDPLEMKVIGDGGDIGDALAVTRDRLIMRGVLETEYKNVKIPSTSTVPIKLQYVQDLKLDAPQSGLRGESQESSKGGEQFELLHFKEVWLDVAAYGGYTFQKDTYLPELSKPKEKRTFVPAGTKLEDVKNERGEFNCGAYFQKVGDLILDIFPCDKRKHLTHCVNNIGESFHGLGEWDLLPLQEQKNTLRSLMFAKEKFDSLSPTLVRDGAVDPHKLGQARAVPNAIVVVSNLDPSQPLSSAVDRVQPGNSVSGAYELDNIIANSMQYRTGANTLESGAPDMVGRQKTATAVNAAQSQSEGRRGPMLQLRGEMERQQAIQILVLRKENWPEQMYEALDKKVGGDAGQWFRQSDIHRDFKVEVVPESWWPQTAEQRKEDLAALYAIAGPMGNPQVMKALWNRATELHGRGLDLNSYQSDKIEARIRLERVRQVAEALEKSGEVPVYDSQGSPVSSLVNLVLEKSRLVPELPAIDPNGEPICTNAILDRHDEYIDSYSSWLLTSEGRSASAFVRAVVNKVVLKHYDGKVEFAQFMEAEQMKAKAPAMAAQEQMANQQKEQAAAEAAQADEQAKQDMVVQALGEHALKQDDREHEAQVEMAKKEHEALVGAATQVASQGQ
jgi:transcription elongation factor Elf1